MTSPVDEPAVIPDAADVPAAVAAATVVLLRDGGPRGDEHLEVLLLERHLDSDFAGGALVFPGGKVDDADRSLEASRWTTSASLTRWRERLGAATDEDALGLLVAAVRETFEEAGVLLARREDGQPLDPSFLGEETALDARRRLAARGERWDWRPWLEDEGLSLDLGALALWSWWVTPVGQHRRFDTRFLAARLPQGQVACHDGEEATALRWVAPQDALDAQARGESTVIFPTRRNLRALAGFPTAEDAWSAARDGRVDTSRIEPRMVEVEGRILVQHPDGSSPEPI